MKKIIILSICVVACFLSCNEKPSPRNVDISIVWVTTNYHPCDSIQRLAGYYPARIYMSLALYNMSKDTLFLPLHNRYNTSMKSTLDFSGNIYAKVNLWERGILFPNDTTIIALIVDLDNIPISDIFSRLHNFIKDVEINYKVVKSDTLLSKYPMPDSVIFNIDRDIKLDFLDIEDLGVESDWIL